MRRPHLSLTNDEVIGATSSDASFDGNSGASHSPSTCLKRHQAQSPASTPRVSPSRNSPGRPFLSLSSVREMNLIHEGIQRSKKAMKTKRRKLLIISLLSVALLLCQDSLSFTNSRAGRWSSPSQFYTVFKKYPNDYHHHHDGINSTPMTPRSLRRGKDECAKTPYVSPHEAVHKMPPPLPPDTSTPSHVALCEELIKRNLIAQNYRDNPNTSSTPKYTIFKVHESPQICRDYKRPHSALMEIISSSIIAYVGKRFGLEYSQRCHTSIDIHDEQLDFDMTTIQQIFPSVSTPINERELTLAHVAHNLCPKCLQEYNQGVGHYDSRQKAHHCLAFPALSNVHVDKIRMEHYTKENPDMPEIVLRDDVLDGENHLVRTGLGAVLPLVMNRLNHAARDWSTRAEIPAHDPRSGAVIFLDPDASLAIPFWVFEDYIEHHCDNKNGHGCVPVTHISILSGPDCSEGMLRSIHVQGAPQQEQKSVSCLQYGLELKEYLRKHYKDKQVDVSFNFASSTATSYTRMILCHTLICPPGTISCFLPALAKPRSRNAIILESPMQREDTFHWFTSLGHSAENINVVTLTMDQLHVDQEQANIDAKYSGFTASEIVGQTSGGGGGTGAAAGGSALQATTGDLTSDSGAGGFSVMGAPDEQFELLQGKGRSGGNVNSKGGTSDVGVESEGENYASSENQNAGNNLFGEKSVAAPEKKTESPGEAKNSNLPPEYAAAAAKQGGKDKKPPAKNEGQKPAEAEPNNNKPKEKVEVEDKDEEEILQFDYEGLFGGRQ